MKWKVSLDEVTSFLNEREIPCLLIVNKVEYVNSKDGPTLQEFASKNGFCGCFRTSAKTGYNVSESMEYLIRIIIKRMEDIQSKGIEVFSNERKGIFLVPEKQKQRSSIRTKNDNGVCF